MEPLELLEKTAKMSSRDYVYHTLRTNILNMRMPPGSSIAENEISELLQVSRTPIREAFVKLSEEELIEIFPQRGSFVTRIDLQQITEARFVRETMEVAVARLACDRLSEEDHEDVKAILAKQSLNNNRKNYDKLHELDEQFHKMIFDKCSMSRTWSMVQQMQTHYKRLRLLMLSVNSGWDALIAQHHAIAEQIRAKNKEQVEVEMRHHLRLFVLVQGDQLRETYPDFFK